MEESHAKLRDRPCLEDRPSAARGLYLQGSACCSEARVLFKCFPFGECGNPATLVVWRFQDAEARRQNFGQVSNSYIRLVDESNEVELIHYDLGEDFSIETAVVVGELYRHNGEWKFNAIGSGFQGGLAALCGHYGIEVA